MNTSYQENKTFENTNFSDQQLVEREYNKCTFNNCDFGNSNLKKTDFIDCLFQGCNLSMAAMEQTGLKGIRFVGCKLMGINFSACSDFLFSVSFTNCQLNYASFFRKKMNKTVFTDCALQEVDFEETELSAALFNNCDLLNANFRRTTLENADLRTASNYIFDPEVNKIKKAKFSFPEVLGLLAKYDIDITLD